MLPFLKLIPLKDYIYGAAIVLLCVGFLSFIRHERAIGASRILQADALALTKAQAAADIQTAKLAKQAQEASHAHDQELADLRYYRVTHPVHIRVCHDTHDSIPGVPGSSAANGGNAGSSPPRGGVQPVLAGDNGSDDLGPMLELLAGRADKLSAQLREFQKR
jgi:hypothetical protein